MIYLTRDNLEESWGERGVVHRIRRMLREQPWSSAGGESAWEAELHTVLREITRERLDTLDWEDIELLARIQALLTQLMEFRRAIRSLGADAENAPQASEVAYMPSPRERQVLSLLTLGLTSGQIATRLQISERTVRKHLDSVYRKGRLSGRAAAAAWWQRQEAGTAS